MNALLRLLPCLACAWCGALAAQQHSSLDVRQSSGAGPFPVYLALQVVHGSNQPAFERLVNAATPLWGGQAGRVRMWGVEISAGAIHNTNSFRWIKGWKMHSTSMEVGWKYLERVQHDGTGAELRVGQGIWSARYGRRFNVYYPITIHVQAGPVFVHRVWATLANGDGADALRASGSTPPWSLVGVDLRARAVFFDPVGAGGGFSLFVEGQVIASTKRPSTGPLADLIGAGAPLGGGLTMGVFSVGTTIPLALRMR